MRLNDYKEAMADLLDITRILQLSYPHLVLPVIREFQTGFTVTDDERLSKWIDKLIKQVIKEELYEVAADLLKIKNTI